MSEPASVLQLTPHNPMPIIYGPIESRRFGNSLGINALGENKICSFDCVYCSLGFTQIRMNQIKKEVAFPSVDEVETLLRHKLRELSQAQTLPKSLTVSGNGEPTLYPHFAELSERLVTVRNEMCPHIPLMILTNGAHIDNRRTVQALDMYNERMIKVDAGSDNDFRRINNPLIRANLSKVINGARKLKNTIVQSMFIQGAIDNTTQASVEEWMEVVGIIQPKEVHIYSLKGPSLVSGILPADEDALYTVASKLKRRTQLEAKVFT